ncbi:MAG TPA: VCBS domain-containing protein, partial [Pseudomonadales bacterium]|nr:VCBS domain-containing protein [Pseudomonadales bacterium]
GQQELKDVAPPELVGGPLEPRNDFDADQITLDLSGKFKDAVSGSNLTYGATSLPSGLSIDPETGVISGKVDGSASQGGNTGTIGEYAVTITVTDPAGNSSEHDFIWTIDNPPPEAEDDDNSIAEGGISVAGNVLTGEGSKDPEASKDVDPDGDELIVAGVVPGANQSMSADGVGDEIKGEYGTLILNPDGSYSYILDPNNMTVRGLVDGETLEDTFTYTISDGEGGFDTANLIITINGKSDGVTVDVPTIHPDDPVAGEITDHVVFESGLVNGSSPNADDLKVESSFTLKALDGLATDSAISIAYNGGTLELSKAQIEALSSTAQTISTPYGTFVFNGYSKAADGTITVSYEYTLERAPQVPGDDTRDDIVLTITDRDGGTENATLSIKIIDDAPTAKDDANSIVEEQISVAGNVISAGSAGDVADIVGADGAKVSAVISTNTPANNASNTNGVLEIEGQFGTLTINPDGSYTYALDNTNLAVQGLNKGETLTENFIYTITDGDGDTASANLKITINGANDGVTIDVPVVHPDDPVAGDVNDHVVFESGLSNGSNPSSDDTKVESSFTLKALDGLDP